MQEAIVVLVQRWPAAVVASRAIRCIHYVVLKFLKRKVHSILVPQMTQVTVKC